MNFQDCVCFLWERWAARSDVTCFVYSQKGAHAYRRAAKKDSGRLGSDGLPKAPQDRQASQDVMSRASSGSKSGSAPSRATSAGMRRGSIDRGAIAAALACSLPKHWLPIKTATCIRSALALSFNCISDNIRSRHSLVQYPDSSRIPLGLCTWERSSRAAVAASYSLMPSSAGHHKQASQQKKRLAQQTVRGMKT